MGKNKIEFELWAIIYNNGDCCEYEEEENTGVYFEDKEDAVTYLKNKADIIINEINDLDNYNFDNIDKDVVNIFVKENENHISNCESLFEEIDINKLREKGSKVLSYHDFLIRSYSQEKIKIYKKGEIK
jgi:hypothetical protein